MRMKRAPYGSWASRISAAQLAQSSVALGDLRVLDGIPYWVESRPAEAGRYVIVTPNGNGSIRELTPPSFGSRTRVNEYGGAPYVVTRDALYFSNWADQRIHVQRGTRCPCRSRRRDIDTPTASRILRRLSVLSFARTETRPSSSRCRRPPATPARCCSAAPISSPSLA